jgi:hypothetical protein
MSQALKLNMDDRHGCPLMTQQGARLNVKLQSVDYRFRAVKLMRPIWAEALYEWTSKYSKAKCTFFFWILPPV